MWKLEREEFIFKIYDERKTIAGYFAPEYGEIYPEDKAEQVIEEMHKKHEKVKGGYMMLPMTKFGIFEEGKEMNIDQVEQQLRDVHNRVLLWKNLMTESGTIHHKITVSHTDHDMLSITLGVIFASPIPLEKDELLKEITKILDLAHHKGLL